MGYVAGFLLAGGLMGLGWIATLSAGISYLAGLAAGLATAIGLLLLKELE